MSLYYITNDIMSLVCVYTYMYIHVHVRCILVPFLNTVYQLPTLDINIIRYMYMYQPLSFSFDV